MRSSFKIFIGFLLAIFVTYVQSEDCGEDVFCPDDSLYFNYTSDSPVVVRFYGKDDLLLDDYFFQKRGLNKALKIEIIETKIVSISPLAFAGLNDLTVVTLIDNNLSTFPNSLFEQNPQMRKVIIKQNPDILVSNEILKNMFLDELVITDCSLGGKLTTTSFSAMPSLSYLNISGNFIGNLPSFIFDELGELEVLDLSRNELTSFPMGLFENISLAQLYLARNPLHNLNGVVLRDLIKLDLSYCKFESIDETTFSELPHLTELILRTNRIHQISPKALANLRHLEHLDLSDNHLHGRLPADLFAYNIVLETLRLNGNLDLGEFGSFDAHMDHLYLLDLSDCGLQKINELKRYPTLARLILANNSLTHIPNGVISSKLKVLDLSGNQISKIESIKFPRDSTLSQLKLDRNPIQNVNPAHLARIPIRLLSLSNCELKSLWSAHNAILNSVQRLIISNNQLTSLSQSDIEVVPLINTIELDGNPLICDNDFQHFIQIININSPELSKHLLRSVCGEYRDSDLLDPIDNNDLLINDLIDSKNRLSEEKYDSILENIEDDNDGEIIRNRFPSYLEENGWTTAATAIITFAIVFSMALIAFSIIRYTRRPQIPQRIMIGNRPSYHPLREDMNIPTTPISTRIDMKGAYPNETYKSTTYHHSKITPERT